MSKAPLQINVVNDEQGKPRYEFVRLPGFADREDLVAAYAEARTREGLALARVYAAAIGMTTRIGREAGTTFEAHNCNVFAYGGVVYNHLRERGVEVLVMGREGAKVMDAIFESLPPAAAEVAAAEVFSEAGGAPKT